VLPTQPSLRRRRAALGTGTELVDAWDELLEGKGYPRYFADYTKAEPSALLIRSFQGFVVDGLLQVEAYARVVVSTDEALIGRMKRQSVLTKDDAPTVCVVLDESVLHREVGDRVVMREQLEYLISVSKLPNVTLQIALTAYYRVQGSFAIATQPNGGDVAYLRHLTGGNTTTEPADIVRAETAFATLQARALSPSASRDMIRSVIDERYG
jgi:hypothetical protein